jgi:hypothetical protein
MENSHVQYRIDPMKSLMLRMLAESSGIREGALVEAAIDALLVALARQGKLGGDIRAKILSGEQRGTLRHQRLIDRVADSEDVLRPKPPAPKEKKKRGRPKKVRAMDPLLAELTR